MIKNILWRCACGNDWGVRVVREVDPLSYRVVMVHGSSEIQNFPIANAFDPQRVAQVVVDLVEIYFRRQGTLQGCGYRPDAGIDKW